MATLLFCTSSALASESDASIAVGFLIQRRSQSRSRRSVTPTRSGPTRLPLPIEWHPTQARLLNNDSPRLASTVSTGTRHGEGGDACWAASDPHPSMRPTRSKACQERCVIGSIVPPLGVSGRVAKQPVPADPERIRGHAHVDEERPPADVRAGQEAPEAAVVGLVAVVAHHEVVVGRNDDRAPIVRGRTVARRVPAHVVRQLQRAYLPQAELVVRHLVQGRVQRVRLVQPFFDPKPRGVPPLPPLPRRPPHTVYGGKISAPGLP